MPVKKEEEEDILLLYPGREEPRAQDDVKSCHQLEVFVEVPTLELVDHRRKLLKLEGGEETKPIMPPKIKIKKGPKALPNFDLDTINKRLEVLGPPGVREFDVTLDHELKCFTVPRAFISNTWGGNPQETFPIIGKKHAALHNLRDWMFPNLLWNPAGPQIAGVAGLFFESNGIDCRKTDHDDPNIYRVIVRLPEGPMWLYVGQYILLASEPLTRDEWRMQAEKVKNTWVKEILRRGWGTTVRTRVALRKFTGREPDDGELEAAEQNSVAVTQEDIRQAYDDGEEFLGVYVLKCVGYDEEFQRQICERFKNWVPPPPKPKANKKKPKTRKRKRDVTPEIELLSDLTELDDSDSEDKASVFDDDEDNEVVELQYIPAGTRSRPRANR